MCKIHTIQKLRTAYKRRAFVNVDIRYDGHLLADDTQIQQLLGEDEQFVVLTTHLVDGAGPTSSLSTPNRSSRTPLAVVNAQLPASPALQNVDVKPIIKPEPGNDVDFRRVAVASPPRRDDVGIKNERGQSPMRTPSEARSHVVVKPDPKPEIDAEIDIAVPEDVKKVQAERLQKLMEDGTPEQLEEEVRDMHILLESMKKPLAAMQSEHQDAKHWVRQIDNLLKHNVDTPTVIGVVGNTGAGKSSVINAMLEEERLVPTNCMRACTAVVTEMSWNSSDKPTAKYRAQIEFIQASDWEKDLQLCFQELLDANGHISREASNEESEAGVAYAKLRSVYPLLTKEQLAESTVEKLLNHASVKKVLGTTMEIERAKSEDFYKALQAVIDSKEKKKGERKEMEFWPLIKVVKLYTKADALSTGAIIVDLPGVHDSNAARAAVAQGYMKQCTGLFIVAPINRAVDDKAAKSLLGESFKRQLKFDGTYSRITFICSKTDDISLTEAADSLGLDDQLTEDYDKIDELQKQVRTLKTSMQEFKDTREVYQGIIDDCVDNIEIWEALKDKVEEGKKVWAPKEKKTKNKRKKVNINNFVKVIWKFGN